MPAANVSVAGLPHLHHRGRAVGGVHLGLAEVGVDAAGADDALAADEGGAGRFRRGREEPAQGAARQAGDQPTDDEREQEDEDRERHPGAGGDAGRVERDGADEAREPTDRHDDGQHDGGRRAAEVEPVEDAVEPAVGVAVADIHRTGEHEHPIDDDHDQQDAEDDGGKPEGRVDEVAHLARSPPVNVPQDDGMAGQPAGGTVRLMKARR